jgi:predicted PurR-regulated permease PerM
LPIGVFTGLAMFVPYVGFGIGWCWPARRTAGVRVGQGLRHGRRGVRPRAGVEGFYLTPRLVGERIGLHPLAVIFALLAFGQLLGFVGVLIALPASAVLLVAIRRMRTGYFASRLYQG